MASQKHTMQLSELLGNDLVSGTANSTANDVTITALSSDSRQVKAGSLFVAYPGTQVDGRDFIEKAQAQGAVAVIYDAKDFQLPQSITIPAIAIDDLQKQLGYFADKFFGSPSAEMQIFAVTGTNGKTTCAYMLTQALTQLNYSTAMIGTIGVGKLDKLIDSGHTTPGVIEIHRLLAQWANEGITHVCMEVSSHALDQGRVNGVQFFCTLFTNLSHDHLDYHGTLTNYQLAKQKLFTDFSSELVITNNEDAMGASLIDVANSDFIVTYGKGGDIELEKATLSVQGMTLEIEAQSIDFSVNTSLIGSVNVPNILMLVATLLALSLSIEEIQKIIANLKSAPGRMEAFINAGKPTVVIDYAHTPDALSKALQSVKAHCQGELWCVFGCGGERDEQKRPLMGAAADEYADHIIVTNDNPRSDSPEKIVSMITKGINKPYDVIYDRAKAIETAVKKAQKQDWILVAGKGHETTQQIGEQKMPFSDKAQIQECLGVAV